MLKKQIFFVSFKKILIFASVKPKTLYIMTAKQLYDHVRVRWAGYGQYNVEITYRGKTYKCRSNNSQAWDYMNWERGDEPGPYTSKQAYQAFWNECCQKNHIGKFSFLR